MTLSLGVKKIFNKLPKNIDIPVSQIFSFSWIKTKESGQTNSEMMNMSLYRPNSKYLRSIKIQGKRTPDGRKQINS